MTNLLKETKNKLEDMGVSTDDVDWVGSSNGEFAISWAEFEAIANVNYDAGFGAPEIATDLVVVLKDGSFLERGEYDGSEWWDDRSSHYSPTKETDAKPFNRVMIAGEEIGWVNLKEMNPDVQFISKQEENKQA